MEDVEAAHDLEAKHPGRVMLVRYEDLGLQPKLVMKNMFRFLDLPWTNQMANYIHSRTTIQTMGAYETSRNSRDTVFKWKQKFSWKDIMKIQWICRKPMARLGYLDLETKKETASTMHLMMYT